jgi:hypothetical protein
LPPLIPLRSRCIFKAFNSNAGEFRSSIRILEHG